MNMIEKAARAIAIACNENPDALTGSLRNENERIWEEYIVEARAAIRAMRELTPEMEGLYPPLVQKSEFLGSWRAMIDAALNNR